MNKAPTIRSSAQARLLLYRLASIKLTDAEQRLLLANSSLWKRILGALEENLNADAITKLDRTVLNQAFSHIDRTTREGLQRQLERLTGQSLWLGVHATDLLESFIDEHIKLFKSLQREHLDKISLAIKRGIREGQLQKDIAKNIRQMTNISKRRAQLIARNAPLQYSGALTKHYQLSANIKEYFWQTSQDEKVRNSHRIRNNKVYAWDGPGPYPRSEVNCRCDAIPVIT